MNYAFLWLFAVIILLVVEALTVNITTIWFAGGGAAAMLCAVFRLNGWIQVSAFVIVSALLLIFTRPAVKRAMKESKPKTNADALIGEKGIVIDDIIPYEAPGSVKIKGNVWSAKPLENKKITAGSIVEIKEIKGVHLIVEDTGEKEE